MGYGIDGVRWQEIERKVWECRLNTDEKISPKSFQKKYIENGANTEVE